MLTEKDLIDLNERVLDETRFEGDRPHGVQNPQGLKRCVRFTAEVGLADPIDRAAFLCCALIAHHPFNDGNHRTSLEAAILQLLFEGYFYFGTEDQEKALYNWRYDFEAEHHLESIWCNALGGWDNGRQAAGYVLELTKGPYGEAIRDFLRANTREYPVGSALALLPPALFAEAMSKFPPGAWKKEIRRARRPLLSQLRREVWPLIEAKRLEVQAAPRRRPQKPWREDP